MSHHRDLIAGTLGAVAFDTHGWFSWCGKRDAAPPPRVRVALDPGTLRSYLLVQLRHRLYDSFYTRGAVRASIDSDQRPSPSPRVDFPDALSAANSGRGSWERDWAVMKNKGDWLAVARNGLTLNVEPGEVEGNADRRLLEGEAVALRLPKELRAASPGFYLALSEEAMPAFVNLTVRVYWNVTPAGAIRLMHCATRRLNEARLPFRLKALDDPAAYRRCDAAVLYLPKREFERAAPILGKIYRAVAPCLKPPVPAFTKRLAPGVALAEDPASGDSFGTSRCKILAEGLLLAHEAGERTLEGRLRVIESRFAESGIDLSRPYLSPNSNDACYDVELDGMPEGTNQRTATSCASQPDVSPESLLADAGRIAERLAEEAIWVNDRCVWVGPDTASQESIERGASTWSAVGPSLYTGTAGIALFLAELYAATGNPETRQTALGAIRHALSALESPSFKDGSGLYTGGSGVALAAARCGVLLSEPHLLERSLSLARRSGEGAEHSEPFDLLTGRAGVIVALMALRDLLHEARLLDLSVTIGASLLASAEREGTGLSWRDPAARARKNLTGYSHGAAGVGHAFLELYRENGDEKFREGAEGAFEYERRWFDPSAGNWRDFRELTVTAPGRKRGEAFAVSWCHGAPGIALSRMRAHEILGRGRHTEEARIGLETTRGDAERGLSSAEAGYSLCHGLAGEADVLLCGLWTMPEAEGRRDVDLVHTIAKTGMRELGLDGSSRSAGIAESPPGLMLGLAGFGHLLLRLRDPRIPSALLIRSGGLTERGHFAVRS